MKVRIYFNAIIFTYILIMSNICNGQIKLEGEVKEYFLAMNKYSRTKEDKYYQYFRKILHSKDTIQARKAILYLLFEDAEFDQTLLFWIQGEEKQLGLYKDYSVLERLYKKFKNNYDFSNLKKDSSLLDVHQAYIQFLSVCNYEKIKPLYLQELSETIRKGDYTYAFNSYLLPEHWTEAADTLMKYYWDVKDDDTREKMNVAIVKMKRVKAVTHYLTVMDKEKIPIIISMMGEIYLSKMSYQGEQLYEYLKKQIKRKDLKEYFK